MGVLLGPAIVEGNKVEVLLNGDQIFPAMLAAIDGAKQTITFETYIYWEGKIGQAVRAAPRRARTRRRSGARAARLGGVGAAWRNRC